MEEIEKWVREQLDKGYTPQQIKQSLIKSNYDSSIVDNVLSYQKPEENIKIPQEDESKKLNKKTYLILGLVLLIGFSFIIITLNKGNLEENKEINHSLIIEPKKLANIVDKNYEGYLFIEIENKTVLSQTMDPEISTGLISFYMHSGKYVVNHSVDISIWIFEYENNKNVQDILKQLEPLDIIKKMKYISECNSSNNEKILDYNTIKFTDCGLNGQGNVIYLIYYDRYFIYILSTNDKDARSGIEYVINNSKKV